MVFVFCYTINFDKKSQNGRKCVVQCWWASNELHNLPLEQGCDLGSSTAPLAVDRPSRNLLPAVDDAEARASRNFHEVLHWLPRVLLRRYQAWAALAKHEEQFYDSFRN